MQIPDTIDFAPTWGEIGILAIRLALSKETAAFAALAPELGKALAIAQAFQALHAAGMSTDEQQAYAQPIMAAERAKIEPALPGGAMRLHAALAGD